MPACARCRRRRPCGPRGHSRLLTANDDFNALAVFELRRELARDHVYRVAPEGDLLDLEPA